MNIKSDGTKRINSAYEKKQARIKASKRLEIPMSFLLLFSIFILLVEKRFVQIIIVQIRHVLRSTPARICFKVFNVKQSRLKVCCNIKTKYYNKLYGFFYLIKCSIK